MSHPRSEKIAEVQDLEQQLRSSPVVILTDYRGLTVNEIGALRAKLHDASLEYRVAKNTLLGRAAEQAGIGGLTPYLVGPTAVLFGRDEAGAPARILQEFIRQYRKLGIKGGVVEGQVLGPDGIQALATLPTKLELMAQLMGVILGPMRGLVTVLSGPPRGLVTALDALRKQREAASGAAAPPTEDLVSEAQDGAAAGDAADASAAPQDSPAVPEESVAEGVKAESEPEIVPGGDAHGN